MPNGDAIKLIFGGLILIGVGYYALTNYTDSAVHAILGWPFSIGGAIMFIVGIIMLFRGRRE
jgi:TRAP-type C4-dicarboxylate transport system permease small subunit